MERVITGKDGPKEQKSFKPKAYYKAAQLLKQLKRSTNKVSSNLKGSKVREMECMVFDIMRYTSKAYDLKEDYSGTLAFLIEARRNLLDVKLNVRILLDLNQIKSTGYSELTRLEGNLSSQLSAWENATRKRMEKQSKL